MGVSWPGFISRVILIATAFCCQATYAETTAIEGVSKECIDEPVFSGRACIYQANRGAEQTIVLVHGLNGRALHDWQHQIPVLAQGYHVLTFDLPGFGDSGKDVAYYSPTEYARFIHFLVERYASDKIVLVGHSMGGAISLRYSANYPQQVERLILVDVAGVLHRVAYARQLAKGWVQTNATDDSRFLSLADRVANKLLSKAEPLTGPVVELMAGKLLRHELLNVEPAVISAMTLVNENLSDALSRIELPTFLIWGENDRVAPMRTAQVLQGFFPTARLAVISNAAHVPMIEQPERFNELFLAYLEGAEIPAERVVQVRVAADTSRRKSVTCRNESGKFYQGDYDSLSLINCSGVTIRNAQINTLKIKSSTARIEEAIINSDDIALEIKGSDVLITNSELSGDIAILTSASRLDLAGVRLVGERYAVRGGKSSSLVFSVSEISSPIAMRPAHEFVKVDRRHPL